MTDGNELDDLWAKVPTLTPTVALCLLALDGDVTPGSDGRDFTTIDEVAAVTGISTSTVGASLRALAKAGHVVKVPYLAVDRRGRDIARPGYRLAESEA